MKVAVVGVTGLVGRKMLEVLAERAFPVDELVPVASERSLGQEVRYSGKSYTVVSLQDGLDARPDIALFSAGSGVSREWGPKYAGQGSFVIDNSSAWRMEPGIPLVVPEVNPHTLTSDTRLIANPNCSTIQMVVALAPLHRRWQLRRLVISTYQSITGTGKHAVAQYEAEREGRATDPVYPHQIFENCLPHCDIFLENDYTREEMKLVHETRKILDDNTIGITATAVRVPVMGGHSESVNASFASDFTIAEVKRELADAAGVVLSDAPADNLYPMPLHAHDSDAVYVGRIRRDESAERTINLWIVSDNLRKGAATNAVQIAEVLVTRGILPSEQGAVQSAQR